MKKALARGLTDKRDVGAFVRRGISLTKLKYPLSGLLKCHACGASLVVTGVDQRYVCASFTNGGESACDNRTRLKRLALEDRLLKGLAAELESPEYERLFGKRVGIPS